MQAEIDLAAMPYDNEDRGRVMRYRQSLESLRTMVDREIASTAATTAGGIQRANVTYIRPTS